MPHDDGDDDDGHDGDDVIPFLMMKAWSSGSKFFFAFCKLKRETKKGSCATFHFSFTTSSTT